MIPRLIRNYLYSNRRGDYSYAYNLREIKCFNNDEVHNIKDNIEEMVESDDKINFVTRMNIENTDKNQNIQYLDLSKNVVATVKCRRNVNKKKTEVVNVS